MNTNSELNQECSADAKILFGRVAQPSRSPLNFRVPHPFTLGVKGALSALAPGSHLTHKSYPDSTEVDYVYDLVGKVQSVNDPTGTYGFAYDNMGRLTGTTTQYAFLTGTTFSNSYSYDAASNSGFGSPVDSTASPQSEPHRPVDETGNQMT